jgi:hypothetical protein
VTSAPVTPEVPTESQLPDLGDVLVVVGTSGFFERPEDRTTEAPARFVLWDDGRAVVAISDVTLPPVYRSLVLSPDELAEFRRILLDARLETYHSATVMGPGFCIDCNVTILQTDVSGQAVEIAVAGLPPSEPEPGGYSYPDGVGEAVRVVNILRARVRTDGEAWTGEVPTVMTTPVVGGG